MESNCAQQEVYTLAGKTEHMRRHAATHKVRLELYFDQFEEFDYPVWAEFQAVSDETMTLLRSHCYLDNDLQCFVVTAGFETHEVPALHLAPRSASQKIQKPFVHQGICGSTASDIDPSLKDTGDSID